MYEWTYRHAETPRSESLLTMGLFDLVESPQGLLRRKNPVADRFRQVATDAAANAPIARAGAAR